MIHRIVHDSDKKKGTIRARDEMTTSGNCSVCGKAGIGTTAGGWLDQVPSLSQHVRDGSQRNAFARKTERVRQERMGARPTEDNKGSPTCARRGREGVQELPPWAYQADETCTERHILYDTRDAGHVLKRNAAVERVHGPSWLEWEAATEPLAPPRSFPLAPPQPSAKGQIRTSHGVLAHTEFGMPATAEHETCAS